ALAAQHRARAQEQGGRPAARDRAREGRCVEDRRHPRPGCGRLSEGHGRRQNGRRRLELRHGGGLDQRYPDGEGLDRPDYGGGRTDHPAAPDRIPRRRGGEAAGPRGRLTESTMIEHVKTEIADGVMTLTLQRPEKKNALTGAMYDALSDALKRAET